MRMGLLLDRLTLSETARAQLVRFARSHSLPAGLVIRSMTIWLAADGLRNASVAARLRPCGNIAASGSRTGWRAGTTPRRADGLGAHDDDAVARLFCKLLRTKPTTVAQWSGRTVAAGTHIPNSTVQRHFALAGVQPHRTKSFKLSTDPFLVEKVRDIVGPHLKPPDHALVLCVDEQSQLQALDRRQPNLPMMPVISEASLTTRPGRRRSSCSRRWV